MEWSTGMRKVAVVISGLRLPAASAADAETDATAALAVVETPGGIAVV
jgi:hypothetical protein